MTADALRPRTLSDWAVYGSTAVVGPAIWFWIVSATGAGEAWDEGVYWPVMFAAALTLGLLLGSSGLPYVDEPAPVVGFGIAGLLFVTQIPCLLITSSGAGVSFLPLTLVLFLPLWTAAGGAVSAVGVVANRGLRRLARRVFAADPPG